MMQRDQLINILKIVYSQYPNSPLTAELVNLWFSAVGQLDFEVVAKAFQNWTLKSTSGFPPVVGNILEEIRLLKAPWLALSYEEAKAKNHPAYRKAHRDVYGKPQAYSPYADPNSLIQNRDLVFLEKRCREAYYTLLDRHRALPFPELESLAARVFELEGTSASPGRAHLANQERQRAARLSHAVEGNGESSGSYKLAIGDREKTAAILAAAGFGPSQPSPRTQEEWEAERQRQKDLLATLKEEAAWQKTGTN